MSLVEKQKIFSTNIYEDIDERKVKICIVGLGYVGLPLALSFIGAGFDVYGIDTDYEKLELLQSGRSPIYGIEDEAVRKVVSSRKLRLFFEGSTVATTKAKECNFVIGCVPTPVSGGLKPNLLPLKSLVDLLEKIQTDSKPRTFILESTTYPGCTNELFGHLIVNNLSVVFSPERVDPGNEVHTLKNTPKVIGGEPDAVNLAAYLYNTILDAGTDMVKVSSTVTAEMTKLIENMFRFVNISLSSELDTACKKLGIDYREALEAAATKPFGFMKFDPSYKIGGHCIPVDPYYFKNKCEEGNIKTKILDSCTEVNEDRLKELVDNIKWILDAAGKTVNKTNIGIVGMSYKKNVSDTRNSIGSVLYNVLTSFGANVYYHDPYVRNFENISSVPLTKFTELCDIVIILTGHDNIDYKYIEDNVDIIIDTQSKIPGPWIYKL